MNSACTTLPRILAVLCTAMLATTAPLEAAPQAEAKADWLANKKKNIEARGKTYDHDHMSRSFDSMDLDKDGLLTAGEMAAHKASRKGGRKVNAQPRNVPQAPANPQAQAKAPTKALAISGSNAPFAGDPATTVWFNQPGKGFDQSLVLGNGRIGAMVYGDTDDGNDCLNESSVWSGSRVDNDIPGGYEHLPEIRKSAG